jgi:hypothetical protein
MILPLLGGSPAVWNTCIAFYQVVLLAGYLYAHLTTRWLGVRRQAMLHLVLIISALIALPIGISDGLTPPVTSNPIAWLFILLLVSIGLPFFAISTNAPLLQKWFSTTRHPSAKDPYFLYSASNLGSMVALLGYPFLIEPLFPIGEQTKVWTLCYVFLALLISSCAITVWRSSSKNPEQLNPARVLDSQGAPSI